MVILLDASKSGKLPDHPPREFGVDPIFDQKATNC
jgi:hypothetical protein